jgi:uncharacterized protein (TIGR02246 family)
MSDLSPSDQTAIAALWTEYGSALGAGDVESVAALYTPDGDMIAVDGTHAIGREAIAAYYREQLAGRFRGASLQDVEFVPPRRLGADAALMNASWMVHGLEPAPFRVRTTFVVRRAASGWRFAAVRFAAARTSSPAESSPA